MRILLVSATDIEIGPLTGQLSISEPLKEGNVRTVVFKEHVIDILICGVGMVSTAFQLGRLEGRKYDLAIQLGICGAFKKQFQLGDVLRVNVDILSEMGAEDDQDFITYDQLGLPGTNRSSQNGNINSDLINSLVCVKGITVNKVHGNEKSISSIIQCFDPDIESMEGAAFFIAANDLAEVTLQLRAVSNYVEKRDRSKWNVPLAVAHLNEFAFKFIGSLS